MVNNTINDTNCCDLLSKGSSEAYYYLIRIYFPVMCNFAYGIVKDTMAAEDIVNEVFLKLWQQKPGCGNMEGIKKLLYVSVRNASLNFRRSQKREQERHQAFATKYSDDEENMFQEIVFSEMLAEVRKAMDKLPHKMRTIFILGYIKQMSNQEIAAQLNLSNQTVRNQKAKSLIRLKKLLGPQTFSYLLLVLAAIS